MRSALLLLALAACAAAPVAGDPRRWFAAAGERAFAVVELAAAHGASRWLVVGGRPGAAGTAMLFGADGARLAAQELGDDVAYAAAARGDEIAVGMANGDVLRLLLPDLQPELRWRHGKPVLALAFSPDGAWLASGGHDGVVRVGPVHGRAPVVDLDHGAAVLCVAWAADGQRLAAGTRDGRVRLHDRAGRLLRTWNRLGGEVVEVGWQEGRVHCRVQATPIAAPVAQQLPWP